MARSGNLNIDPTLLIRDSGALMLYDPALYIKLLGQSTSYLQFAYLDKEKIFKVDQEYATFATGIPESQVRRDMIRQVFTLDAKTVQFNPDILALIMQRYIDSDPASWNRVTFGTKLPPAIFIAASLRGQLVDGTQFQINIRRLQLMTESLELAFGSEDHARLALIGNALEDTDPYSNNPDWDYLGKAVGTGNTTTASEVITSAALTTPSGYDLDDVEVGGVITGTNIPDGTTIESVDSSAGTITMSAAATGDGTGVAIYPEIEHTNEDYDNIAYIATAKAS